MSVFRWLPTYSEISCCYQDYLLLIISITYYSFTTLVPNLGTRGGPPSAFARGVPEKPKMPESIPVLLTDNTAL